MSVPPVRALLDTHTLLWFLEGDSTLSQNARTLIGDPANEIFVSIANLWEIAIKHNIGKLALRMSFAHFVQDCLVRGSFEVLGIVIPHLDTLSTLPLHHRDPFDRLLIAQAITHDLSIIGTDPVFGRYPIRQLW